MSRCHKTARDSGNVATSEDADGIDSVLDACVEARLPELQRAWHYRSRHDDLTPRAWPAVRVAGPAASARREIHEVPLAEVAADDRIVVERAAGLAAADLVRDAARLLGFSRTTDRVVERVASGVRLAAQRDLVRIEGGRAMLPD